MPPDLEIDHKTPLNGSMAPYTEQVLISTGKPDWKSRIEDEDDAHLLQGLKKLLGRGGRFADPFSNVLLTNSSFEATPSSASSVVGQSGDSDAAQTGSAYVLPSFTYIPSISTTDASLETLIKGFVLPSSLPSHHPLLNTASPTKPEDLPVRQPALQSAFPSARPVSELLVLICGHGGRDSRCGILGPLLVREFEQKLSEAGVSVLKSAPSLSASPHPPAAAAAAGKTGDRKLEARVGTISHIGGHKFAGNIIVYIPPSFSQSGSASNHALAGKGIWYGRVEPRHVEGIVKETILGGKVVGDLFRGGVGRGGEVLRI
ncbi:hypothetical protein AAFC00_005065 [Neodothiora populina]|uniref:Altered inheritance of mitochondria protein 32 n=1 Tax=Neodothiora populina TaxID=2781224 RepID=A0ABR3PJW3_9PEZI